VILRFNTFYFVLYSLKKNKNKTDEISKMLERRIVTLNSSIAALKEEVSSHSYMDIQACSEEGRAGNIFHYDFLNLLVNSSFASMTGSF